MLHLAHLSLFESLLYYLLTLVADIIQPLSHHSLQATIQRSKTYTILCMTFILQLHLLYILVHPLYTGSSSIHWFIFYTLVSSIHWFILYILVHPLYTASSSIHWFILYILVHPLYTGSSFIHWVILYVLVHPLYTDLSSIAGCSSIAGSLTLEKNS